MKDSFLSDKLHKVVEECCSTMRSRERSYYDIHSVNTNLKLLTGRVQYGSDLKVALGAISCSLKEHNVCTNDIFTNLLSYWSIKMIMALSH